MGGDVVLKVGNDTLQTRDSDGVIKNTTVGIASRAGPRSPFRFGSWVGRTYSDSVPTEIIGLPVVDPGYSFVDGLGDLQGTSSAGIVYVDNKLGNDPLLIKLEVSGAPLITLPAYEEWKKKIDGAKPDLWRPSGAPMFTGDWFKVNNGLGIKINSLGEPSRFAPTMLDYWRILAFPECHFDTFACIPGFDGSPGYDYWGGRKKEPEWSQPENRKDWRYTPPQP